MTSASRRRGEAGQTSAEYVGSFALVIVIAAALAALSATDIGHAVLSGASRGICRVINVAGFGGNCSGGSPNAAGTDSHVPTDCTISSTDSTVEGKVTLFSVSAGGDVGYTLERKSDGKWYLTLKGGAKVGLEGAFGEKAGSTKTKEGGEASFGVGLQGDGSSTYRFASEKDARDALNRVEQSVKGRALGTVEGAAKGETTIFGVPVPVPNPIGGLIGAYNGATADYNPHLPSAFERSYDAGVYGGASGSAGTGAVYADGSVSGAAVAGVRFGHDDQRNIRTTTIFYKTTVEGKGSAGVLFGATGSLEGESQVAVTFAAEGPDKGKPLNLSVEDAANLSGGVSTLGEVKTVAGATQTLKKLAVGGNQETGLAGTLKAEYDLTDPRVRGAAQNALSTLGIGVLGGHVDPTGVADLASVAKSVSFVTYDTSKSSTSAGFEVGDLIAFGAEGSYTRKTSKVANAVYLDPTRGGFVPWVQCSS